MPSSFSVRLSPLLLAAALVGGGCGSVTEAGTGGSGGDTGKGGDTSAGGDAGSGAGGSGVGAGGSGAGGTGGVEQACPAVEGGLSFADACTPSEVTCHGEENRCLASYSVSGAWVFGQRVVQLDVSKPAALAEGPLAEVLADLITPRQPACNLTGTGTMSFLMGFHLEQQGVDVSFGLPAPNPYTGFNTLAIWSTEHLDGTTKESFPAHADVSSPDGCAFTTSAFDLELPILTSDDALPDLLAVLPFKGMQISGTFSPSRACIGAYNADQLSAANGCEPAGEVKRFTPGGHISALLSLEEADNLAVTGEGASLCVVLTGDPGAPNDAGILQCTRDAGGALVVKGDRCLATLGPATADCADALAFEADFASSAVYMDL